MKKPSITELVTKLQRALSALMNVAYVPGITTDELYNSVAGLNDEMPPELLGVEVMLMSRQGEEPELALLIPEELMRFFAGRPITWYTSVIVEKRSDGIFFTKNRYGHSSVMVPSLEGEVVLSQEPLVTATFTTPRSKKA